MILIADSGATKTDWRFIDSEGKIQSFPTVGLSPLFWTSKEITAEIKSKFPKKIQAQIANQKSHIYFYGASCSSTKRKQIVSVALKKAFPKSKSSVHHDMLGAARALCGHKKGIAAILGTGSNSCLYDGKDIIEKFGGLTYILGDEGSGAHIGKKIIKAFLNKELPEKINDLFQNKYQLTKDKIFDAIYNQKNPNTFLASFAKFAHEYIQEPFLHELVRKSFSEFFEKTICKYEDHKYIPVGFIGSIAEKFSDILYSVAKENGVTISKIIKSPIDELIKYHLIKNV